MSALAPALINICAIITLTFGLNIALCKGVSFCSDLAFGFAPSFKNSSLIKVSHIYEIRQYPSFTQSRD
jgi:hypothetical protein